MTERTFDPRPSYLVAELEGPSDLTKKLVGLFIDECNDAMENLGPQARGG